MNPRGRCKKCGAHITWLRTNTGKWMPVDDESGRVNPSELFSVEQHKSHFDSCPEAAAFRKRKQQEQHAALDEANTKKAVIAKIGKLARELSSVYGIRRDQLQALALATVGVSNFGALETVPVTWLEERFLHALQALYDHIWSCDAEGLDNGPSPDIWDGNINRIVGEAMTHFARCCQQRAEARGLVPGGGGQ